MPLEAASTQASRGAAPAPDQGDRPPTRRVGPFGLIAAGLVVAAIVVGAIVLLGGGGDDDGGQETVTRAPAVGASLADLDALAADAGHPVYWAGAQPGVTYELTRTEDGRIFIRYLSAGTQVGSPRADFLSVGTYPQSDALATLSATARAQGAETVGLPGGGRAFQDAERRTSAYAAFPGSDHQVEVFDKTPGRALELLRAGAIVPLSERAQDAAAPRAATPSELAALAGRLDHPVYWVGTEAGTTYELTRTSDDRVYVRYLPDGVPVGSEDAGHLTVGSYPQPDALPTLRATAARRSAETIELAGGGFAYVDRDVPDSVYLAYPDADVQIEVYDAGDGRARQLVRAGRVVPVG